MLLHYAPIEETLEGEPCGIKNQLGSARLALPIGEYRPDLVLHGHAHDGRFEGAIGDTPVYNVAVQVIGRKRLHLETELIERLDDRDPEVRQAARQALARLARGTDFGPAPAATRAERLRAMQRWRNWLVLQGTPGGDAPGGRGSGPGVKKAEGVDPRRAMKLLLEGGGPTTLRTEDARVAELSTELVIRESTAHVTA